MNGRHAELLEAECSIAEIDAELIELSPEQVEAFKADNDDAEKAKFLRGETDQPDHHYPYLDDFDFTAVHERLDALADKIRTHSSLNPKYKPLYLAQITTTHNVYGLMGLAHRLKSEELDGGERRATEIAYMAMNREVYGEPEEVTYLNLVAEKKAELAAKDLPPELEPVRERLFAALPEIPDDLPPRFTPDDETIEFVHDVAENLYGDLVTHIPERDEPFTAVEVAEIFREIIRDEFGEAAAGWEVVEPEKGTTISVLARSKTIEVPQKRKAVTHKGLRDLVAHELGVHFLRSVSGDSTDLLAMQLGFPDSNDAEEGLATIMGNAVNGEYKSAGVGHYLAAGLVTFQHKNYRELYEIMESIALLESAKPGVAPTDATRRAAQNRAWARTRRCFSGVDYLPRYKALSYYRGNEKLWKFLQEIKGDDQQLALALSGQFDPSQPGHRRLALEVRQAPERYNIDEDDWYDTFSK